MNSAFQGGIRIAGLLVVARVAHAAHQIETVQHMDGELGVFGDARGVAVADRIGRDAGGRRMRAGRRVAPRRRDTVRVILLVEIELPRRDIDPLALVGEVELVAELMLVHLPDAGERRGNRGAVGIDEGVAAVKLAGEVLLQPAIGEDVLDLDIIGQIVRRRQARAVGLQIDLDSLRVGNRVLRRRADLIVPLE